MRMNEIATARPRFGYKRSGAEFTGSIMDMWAYHHKVRIGFSHLGNPTDNAFIETFNGSLRAECLNLHLFDSLREAKENIEAWRRNYNESRPRSSLGKIAPIEYTKQHMGFTDSSSSQPPENETSSWQQNKGRIRRTSKQG